MLPTNQQPSKDAESTGMDGWIYRTLPSAPPQKCQGVVSSVRYEKRYAAQKKKERKKDLCDMITSSGLLVELMRVLLHALLASDVIKVTSLASSSQVKTKIVTNSRVIQTQRSRI